MRPNRLVFCLFAAFCGLFSLCSRHDVITGAGGSVVSDMDPSLTDTRAGFKLIKLDTAATDSAFSLPAAADPAFSTQLLGYVLMGVNDRGDTLAAHVQFKATAFVSMPGTRPYTGTDSLGGAYLCFRAVDSGGRPSTSIPVYHCDTLAGIKPVNRADKGKRYDEETGVATEAKIGEVTLGGGAGSIRLPDDMAKEIFDARVSGDSSAFYAGAFSVVDYLGALQQAYTPHLIVSVFRDGKEVRDSISGLSRFTAFENAGDGRAALPYSSQHTKRTAVFRVNVGKIIDSLKPASTARFELLNAVLTLNALSAITSCNGEAAGCLALGSNTPNAVHYKIIILDTLRTNELAADSADAANLRSLGGLFGPTAPFVVPTGPFNTFSIKAPLKGVLDKHSSSGNTAGPYLYIYLRPFTDNSMTLWNRKPLVETIFTSPRSQ